MEVELLNTHHSAPPAAAPHRELETACWQAIGVFGDNSCSQLREHVHCRNCSVYSSAASRLLDRPMPQAYRQECSKHFSAKKERAFPHQTSAVLFRLQQEWLALPTLVFQEIAENRPVHSLPHRLHTVVRGLANIRGELLICLDLARLLSFASSDPRVRENKNRLIVVNHDSQRFCFPVDEVDGIHHIPAHELRDPPGTIATARNAITQNVFAWRGRSAGLLNAQLLVAAASRNLS